MTAPARESASAATAAATHAAADAWAASSGLPRPLRRAAIGLALLAIVLAAGARLTGSGHVTLPDVQPAEVRALVFVDRADGGVGVHDARTQAAVAEIGPGDGGFVRGALRALVRGRRQRGVGADAPFHLTRWSDGRLTLDDPATGGHVELGAFGRTNVEAFAALFVQAR